MAFAGLGSRDPSVNRGSIRNPAGDRANGSRGARMAAFSFTKNEKREQAWLAEKSGAAYRGQFAPRGFVLPRPGYEDNSGATRLHKTEASHGLGIRPREPRGVTQTARLCTLRAISSLPGSGSPNVRDSAFGPREWVGRPGDRASLARLRQNHAEAASSSSSRRWCGLCAAMTFSAISAGTKS
jgi:hypothetical protein